MKRVASGMGLGMRGLAALGLTALLSACAPPQATLDEGAAPEHAAIESSEDVTTVSVAAQQPGDSDVLLVRELKIIDDNGQQGVFAKLNRPPADRSTPGLASRPVTPTRSRPHCAPVRSHPHRTSASTTAPT